MADSPKQKRRRAKSKSKADVEARLQRSRQSARECRARKKMRYKTLEDMIASKESENLALREELENVNVYNFPNSTGTVNKDRCQNT